MDILAIRDRLNQLPFEQGKRQVCIGRLSDNVQTLEAETPEDDDEAAKVAAESAQSLEFLRKLEGELAAHDLHLCREDDDPDALYAVQVLREESDVDRSWMAEGIRWVSQITTVALEMVIPGVIGLWLDHSFETRLLGLLGFLLGMSIGIWHLIQMTHRNRVEGGSP